MSSRLVYTCDKCKKDVNAVYFTGASISYPTHSQYHDFVKVERHLDLCEECLASFGIVRKPLKEVEELQATKEPDAREKLFDAVKQIIFECQP